jgi:hypothetical protein
VSRALVGFTLAERCVRFHDGVVRLRRLGVSEHDGCQPGFSYTGLEVAGPGKGDVPALRASWRIYADAVKRDQGWRTFCSWTAGPGCAGPLRRDPAGQRSRSLGRSSHRSTAAPNLPWPHRLLGGSTPFPYAQPSAQLSLSGSASVDRRIAEWTYVPPLDFKIRCETHLLHHR